MPLDLFAPEVLRDPYDTPTPGWLRLTARPAKVGDVDIPAFRMLESLPVVMAAGNLKAAAEEGPAVHRWSSVMGHSHAPRSPGEPQ